jgi:REP element-mobilizing transposase RayT
MSRTYRLQAENCLYHITSRGDDRKKIFISEFDYKKFLEYIVAGKQKYKFYLYAYCLMGNHYHLCLETTQANISRIMQYINTSYTVYYNVKRKRCGHLFCGRFKSIIVDGDSYLLELTRYIHLNPVRAKITDSPDKYLWSSYREYIKPQKESIIDKPQRDRYFKISSEKYKQFVSAGLIDSPNPFLELYAGFILGRERFIKDTLDVLKDQVEGGDVAYKKLIQSVGPDDIINEVALFYKKEPGFLRKAKNKPLLAKKVAVYLMKMFTSLTNIEIGNEFGISYTAVSKAAKDIERLRLEDKRLSADVEKIVSRFKV